MDELTDRYGALPEPARRLAAVARLRLLCRGSGITDVTAASAATVRLSPLTLPDSAQVRLKRMYPGAHYRATTPPCRFPFREPVASARRESATSSWFRWWPI